MSRLPTPGSDDGTWGAVLNDYLSQSLDSGGAIKPSSVANAGAEVATNKGQPNGYAGLDGSGKVPSGQLPAGSGVTSFNTRAGAVSLTKADVTGTGLAAGDVSALGATASAGGDLSGNYPNPTVAKLNGGITLPGSAPSASGQVLTTTGSGSTTGTSWTTPAAGVTLDATSTDIVAGTTTGTGVAGAVGKAADAGHQHPLQAHDHTTANKGGQIPVGGLSATGTASSSTYLRGDNTWTAPPVSSVAGKTGTVTLVEGDIASLTSDLNATEKTANKNQANGYAGLDGSSKLSASQLPSSAVSGSSADYYATSATGTAATDTSNLAAAITATPAGGTLWLDGAYKINAALTFPASITVKGRQKVTYSGLSALPSGPNAIADVQGTSIQQTVAATDAIDVTIQGGTFHMQDIVVSFQSGLASTGYGINCDSGSNVVNLYGATFDGCYVFGHDGNHYALRIWNSLEYTTRDFRSWGGGGILEGCSSGSINYGNAVHIHPYISLVNSGTAHGFARSSAAGTTVPVSGGMMNLLVYIRPQCNIAGAAGTAGTQKMWSDSVGAAFPWYVEVIGADLEASGFNNTIDYGPDTHFIGFDFTSSVANPGNEMYGYLAMATVGQNFSTQQKSVAFGRAALQSQSTGTANAALGYFALQASTTGSGNTALGYSAGAGVIGGTGNTFLGELAGYKGAGTGGNATIASNYGTAIGYQSGPGSTGDPVSYVTLGKNATAGSAASGSQIGNYAIAIGAGTAAQYNGAIAIGVDHNGSAASAAAQDAIALGVANHTVTILGNASLGGSGKSVGFFGASVHAQPTALGTSTGFTAGAGTGMTSTSTSTGGSGASAYTFGDVVLALKNLGVVAA